jgi:nickel-dependent lactate racemase
LYGPRGISGVEERVVLSGGFAAPIAAPPVHQMVQASSRVLIIIDDQTSTTPLPRILPHLIGELAVAGINDEQITLLSAQASHRRMTDEEMVAKLGLFRGRFAVHQHDWRDEANLHTFGHTQDGTIVQANALLAHHDVIIGVGSIMPDRMKGFTGGADIILPGVAGKTTIDRHEWQASMQLSQVAMGIADNPVRARMEEAAAMVGLRAIVNVVTDVHGMVIGCFVGDPIKAHREGCTLAYKVNVARLPGRADIVIVDAHPADRDVSQSIRAAHAGLLALKEGGTLILVAPNPEGVADSHPIVSELGPRPIEELVQMVQTGQVDDPVGAALLVDLSHVVSHAHCIMVSSGLRPEEVNLIGFQDASTVQAALETAFERHGSNAGVVVLRHGGQIMPVAGERAMTPALDRLP